MLHYGVDPVDFEWGVGVFDAFSCARIVFHNLAGADFTVSVYLVVDYVSGFGYSEAVFVD